MLVLRCHVAILLIDATSWSTIHTWHRRITFVEHLSTTPIQHGLHVRVSVSIKHINSLGWVWLSTEKSNFLKMDSMDTKSEEMDSKNILAVMRCQEDSKPTSEEKEAVEKKTQVALKWNNNKSGLAGVDKAKIEEIINRLSKGSPYYKRQQQKTKERHARALAVKERIEDVRKLPERVEKRRSLVDKNVIPLLEATRLRGHVQVCIDFDCFYSAVEALDFPILNGKAHAVGMGTGPNGILATSSYEARKYGVRSGMAIFIAKELCPHLIIQPCRMRRYMHFSKLMESVLARYDPDYHMGSLDEAFIDITHLVSEYRNASQVVAELRNEVKEITGGLTISAGCAPNLMLAKIGADMNKPNGQTILLPSEDDDERTYVMNFIGSLELRKIPGIGAVTDGFLGEAFGFKHVSDLYTERGLVAEVLTTYKTRFLLRIALGIGCPWTDVYDDKEFVRKGIGCNRTFGRERDETKLYARLRFICETLEQDMQTSGIVGGRTFTLRLKTSSFVSFGRSVTLPPGAMLCTADDFEKLGRKLMKSEMPCELRRIGIKLHKLTFKAEPKNSIKKFFKENSKDVLANDVGRAEPEKEDEEETVCTDRTVLVSRELANRFVEQLDAKLNGRIQFKGTGACAACENYFYNLHGENSPHAYANVCPVCHLKCFKNMTALNSHLDECLDQSCDQVKEESENVLKRKKSFISGQKRKREPNGFKTEALLKVEDMSTRLIKQEQVSVRNVKSFGNPLPKKRGRKPNVPPQKNRITSYFNKTKTTNITECASISSVSEKRSAKKRSHCSPSTNFDENISLTQVSAQRSGAIVNKLSRIEESDCRACSEARKNRSTQHSLKHVFEMVCPVCMSRCFKDASFINAHVDECLNFNSDAFKMAIQDRERHYLEQKRKQGSEQVIK